MGTRVIKYTNHDGDFFTHMGKFFAFRHYAHEMGGWQFYTKPGSVWFVAYDDSMNVQGFCSIIQEKNHIYFDNMYVLKEFRGKGISRLLFDARMDHAVLMGQEIRVITDTPIQLKRYREIGFLEYGKRGRYTKFKYERCKND